MERSYTYEELLDMPTSQLYELANNGLIDQEILKEDGRGRPHPKPKPGPLAEKNVGLKDLSKK